MKYREEELKKYKMHPDRVKELTGVKVELYVFTRGQIEEYAQQSIQEITEEEIEKTIRGVEIEWFNSAEYDPEIELEPMFAAAIIKLMNEKR